MKVTYIRCVHIDERFTLEQLYRKIYPKLGIHRGGLCQHPIFPATPPLAGYLAIE
jgi:hypothetical protein